MSEREVRVPVTDIASVIRSKNAGPFTVTLDVMFRDEGDYRHVKSVGFFTRELMAQLYQVPEEDVSEIIYFDPASAVKVNIRRTISAGSPGDTDVYGAQQHAPLLSLRVPVLRRSTFGAG